MIKKISTSADRADDHLTETQNAHLKYLSEPQRFSWREKLSRNLALSGMLLLTIIAVRNAELPSGETVLTSVQNIVTHDWDESLGKISFVSNLFPDSVSVFFETTDNEVLIEPCFGTLIHSWNKNEPYLSYKHNPNTDRVYAIGSGQVMSIADGENEEKIIRVHQGNGLETLYYQLASVYVEEAAWVDSSTCLGQSLNNAQVTIEVRKNGLPVNPSAWMAARNGESF